MSQKTFTIRVPTFNPKHHPLAKPVNYKGGLIRYVLQEGDEEFTPLFTDGMPDGPFYFYTREDCIEHLKEYWDDHE